MLRFDGIVFGPIHSRRLGSSLGINLLPRLGKLCNFDCIYCECGWNRDGVTKMGMPLRDEVLSALEDKLSGCRRSKVDVDSITFSGHGEPTLHPDFPAIVDGTLALRDKYCPAAKVSVLSNATMLHRRNVVEALKKIDNPILKLDAPTDETAALINKPAGHYTVMETVEKLEQFDGNFILQTMFLKGGGFDFETDTAQLEKWMDIVRQLHPRLVMVYTLDRPAPQTGLAKMPVTTIRDLLKPLMDEGFEIQING